MQLYTESHLYKGVDTRAMVAEPLPYVLPIPGTAMVAEPLPYVLPILTHASSGIATSGCLERAPSAFKHGVGIPAARERERESSVMGRASTEHRSHRHVLNTGGNTIGVCVRSCTKKSLDVLQTFSLEAGVVMLWEDDGGWDVLLDLTDEVEASAHQELLPAMDGPHLRLDCLTGDILGFNQTIILGDTLE